MPVASAADWLMDMCGADGQYHRNYGIRGVILSSTIGEIAGWRKCLALCPLEILEMSPCLRQKDVAVFLGFISVSTSRDGKLECAFACPMTKQKRHGTKICHRHVPRAILYVKTPYRLAGTIRKVDKR